MLLIIDFLILAKGRQGEEAYYIFQKEFYGCGPACSAIFTSLMQ